MSRQHPCSVCGKAFRSAVALGQHQSDKHGAPALLVPKKKEPPKVEPLCIECGGKAVLVGGCVIYPHRPDLFDKMFYRCKCGAYCGCHPNSTLPLGYPCGPETRKARSAAHAVFDELWKRGSLSRREAYTWLSAAMNMDPEDCHIGMMSAEQARVVLKLVATRTKEAA